MWIPALDESEPIQFSHSSEFGSRNLLPVVHQPNKRDTDVQITLFHIRNYRQKIMTQPFRERGVFGCVVDPGL
jgi:hypothetical protein